MREGLWTLFPGFLVPLSGPTYSGFALMSGVQCDSLVSHLTIKKSVIFKK